MATARLMTVTEAASYLGRSPEFVRRLIGDGHVPAEKVGARRYVSRVALDALAAPLPAPEAMADLSTPTVYPRRLRRSGGRL
jgi:excisionase family DNA binding protein